MKIALIRQKYTHFGGAERYMARLIEGLLARGHEVHVFAAQWEAGGNPAITIHRVPALRAPGWLKALTFSLNCRRLLAQEPFDVVFSLERTLRQDIYRAGDGCHRQWLRQKNLGKGILNKALTYLNPLQMAYLHLEKRLFRDPLLKGIIANSRRGKEEIVSLYKVPPGKIHVVYNGVDSPEVADAERRASREALAEKYGLTGELRILYVGSGFRRKGVSVLLHAAALLDFPFRLFIVGKGRPGSYRRLARRLGIADRLVFTGPVREMRLFYGGCDLFAFPTLYDPFSNATLEAMASGLPVITTPCNGASELVTDGVNGFVVADPLDAQQLAAVISRLRPEEFRSSVGRRGAETARPFTMEKNVCETLQVIDAVSHSRPTRATAI